MRKYFITMGVTECNGGDTFTISTPANSHEEAGEWAQNLYENSYGYEICTDIVVESSQTDGGEEIF
jgi:hypothetical protein